MWTQGLTHDQIDPEFGLSGGEQGHSIIYMRNYNREMEQSATEKRTVL